MEGRIPVVIDLGTGFVKAGLASQSAPTCCFRNLIGRPRRSREQPPSEEVLLGPELTADGCDGAYDLTSPIDHGVLHLSHEQKLVLEYTLHKALNVVPEEHPVVVTETLPNTPHVCGP